MYLFLLPCPLAPSYILTKCNLDEKQSWEKKRKIILRSLEPVHLAPKGG